MQNILQWRRLSFSPYLSSVFRAVDLWGLGLQAVLRVPLSHVSGTAVDAAGTASRASVLSPLRAYHRRIESIKSTITRTRIRKVAWICIILEHSSLGIIMLRNTRALQNVEWTTLHMKRLKVSRTTPCASVCSVAIMLLIGRRRRRHMSLKYAQFWSGHWQTVQPRTCFRSRLSCSRAYDDDSTTVHFP